MSLKKWPETDTVKFVKLYEKAECLWNFRSPIYKHRSAREAAIQNIIAKMNLPNFGVNELKNKIKNIRSTYQQEVGKIKRSQRNFDGDIVEEYKTNLAWFPIADRFLRGVINSSKNPILKIEDDNISNFEPIQPSLCNIVEAEMSNIEMNDEIEVKYSPFDMDIVQIKQELGEESPNEYEAPTISQCPKKLRLNNDYENVKQRSKTSKSDLAGFSPVPFIWYLVQSDPQWLKPPHSRDGSPVTILLSAIYAPKFEGSKTKVSGVQILI